MFRRFLTLGLFALTLGLMQSPVDPVTAGAACPPNSHFDDCGSACPPTCRQAHQNCIDVCVAGCFCDPGFLLNRQTGQCVPRNQCL